MGLVDVVEFDDQWSLIISNDSMDFNDPKDLDDPQLFEDPSYSMIRSYSLIPSYSMIDWKFGQSKSIRLGVW